LTEVSARRARSDHNSKVDGQTRQIGPSSQPGLLANPIKMGSNRACVDEESVPYLSVSQATSDESENLALTF
jgi:hypothetical protein